MSENTKEELTLDILTDLQSEIHRLKSIGEAYEKELNKYRQGLFIPFSLDPLDIRPVNTTNKWSFLQILEKQGIEAAEIHLNCIADLNAECWQLIDQNKLKVLRVKKDKTAMQSVEKIRKETSPEAKQEKVKYSVMEKQINNIRKRAPQAGMKELVPLVMAFLPGTSEIEAQSALENLFAKEIKKSKG